MISFFTRENVNQKAAVNPFSGVLPAAKVHMGELRYAPFLPSHPKQCITSINLASEANVSKERSNFFSCSVHF